MNKDSNKEILAQEYKKVTPERRIQSEDLPSQVKTNIELDAKKYNNEISNKIAINPTPAVDTKKMKTLRDFFKEKVQNVYVRKFILIILIIFSIFVICFGSFLILTVTNTDTAIFKITLSGQVTDIISKNGVSGVEIFINDELKATTNSSGHYSVSGLNLGSVNIKIKSEEYQELNQEIPINRLFLNYTTKRDFEITPKEKAVIEGSFKVEDVSYQFLDDRIYIEDIEYKIKPDGTFRIEGITSGKQEFKFKSLNYKDISNSIDIKPGINQLPQISLIATGDIDGSLKSYIKEDIVSNIKFNVENIQKEQIEINGEKFKLKDLEIGREYSIQVVAEGYLTREYKITIKQGSNQIFELKLVENGKSITLMNDPLSNSIQFFSSDLDGLNSTKITNFPKNTNIYSYYFNNEENKIYFQSDKDKLSSSSSNLRLIYEIDLNSGKETRLTQNISNLSTLTPQYNAKKLLNITRNRSGSTTRSAITIMDFNGDNRIELKNINEEIASTAISQDQKYVFVKSNSSQISTLRRINAETKEEFVITQGNDITLLDITEDGQKVLFTKKNQQTSFIDLLIYNFNNQEIRTLKENHDGSQYKFINGSDNEYIFFAKRANKTDVYKFSINDNKETKLTNLNQIDVINNIYQQDNYLFYTTATSLYILDTNSPYSYKKVN